MQPIRTETLANGMTLLAEPMDGVQSAAFALLTPAGMVDDPPDRLGMSNLLSDMVQRGAGERDSRRFLFDLENLGADYSVSVGWRFTHFVGACESRNLEPALRLFADLAAEARLPEEELPASKMVCLQEARAYEDDLARRVVARLRANHWGAPYDRTPHGDPAAVESATTEELRRHYGSSYRGGDAILSVAGAIDWEQLKRTAEACFGALDGATRDPAAGGANGPAYDHVPVDSSQTHIAACYPAVPASHEDYYLARSVVAVLSDGMSSRLFTEVREERGLCYTVDATYDLTPDRGSVFCYAATTTERAQETLQVMFDVLARMKDGVTQGEVDRLKARFKSGLIMQQESSAARAGAMASHWTLLGRVKTLDEISEAIDGLTRDRINAYLAEHPPQPCGIATLGAERLQPPASLG